MAITSDIRAQEGEKLPRYLQPTKSSKDKTRPPLRKPKVSTEQSFNIMRASTTFPISNRKITARKETTRTSSILKTQPSKTNLNVKASTGTDRPVAQQQQTTSLQKQPHLNAKTRKNTQIVANKVISNQVKLRQPPPATSNQLSVNHTKKPTTQQKKSRSNDTLKNNKLCPKIVTRPQNKKPSVTMHISSISPTKQKQTLAQDIEQTYINVRQAIFFSSH